MKQFLFLMILAGSFAQAQSLDFNSSDTPFKPIAVDKIRYQIEIVGRVLVFDSTGQRLLGRANEERHWRFGSDKPVQSNWSAKSAGFPDIAIQHEWQVSSEGVLTATIKQYKFMEQGKTGEEVKLGKLIKEQTIKIENFDAIDWVIEQNEARRVVVKFTPSPWNEVKPQNVGPIAINSRDMIVYDNKGNVWVPKIDNADGENVYFGVTTHRGTIYLSYVPFRGAKLIGSVEKNKIKIDDGSNKLTIQGMEHFIPQGVSGNVYGWFDLNRRTDSLYMVKAFGSDKEDSFLRYTKSH